METEDYVPIVEAGAEGPRRLSGNVQSRRLCRNAYRRAETRFQFSPRLRRARVRCRVSPTRHRRARLVYRAWQDEAIALAAHLEHLFKHCWQAQITVSLPRLRPAAGGFRPLFSMTDRELAQLVCALRITFPQLGIVLSTRERAALRDSLALIGVTMMSAGSHTEPGGYTRQGREHLHRTVRGRIVAPEYQDGEDRTRHRAIRDQRRTFPGGNRRSPSPPRHRAGLERLGPGSLRRMTISLNGESRRYARSQNDRGANRSLSIAAAIDFGGAQRPRRASTRMAGATTSRRRPHRIYSSRSWRLNAGCSFALRSSPRLAFRRFG